MTGIKVPHVSETKQRADRPTEADLYRLDEMPDMVAELDPILNPSHEPGRGVVKDGHSVGPDRPVAPGELVRSILGFFPEQLREPAIASAYEVYRDCVAAAATVVVWFFSDRQTRNRDGSILT